jgi:acetyl esterase/lipase
MNAIRFSIVSFFFFLFLSTSAQETIAYKIEKDLLYRESPELTGYMKERCRLDVYYPENKNGFATIVWFHGGGITGGEKYIPEQWQNKGIAIIAVNYRLSPKVKCPEYIEDAAAAVAWVFQHIESFGGSKEKIVVSGHSAGGYLASMAGLDKKYLAEFGIDAGKIAALVPFSGQTVTHSTIREERGIAKTQTIVDEYAPLFHVGKDAPPLYLMTGNREIEIPARYEENAFMNRMMKVAGHEKTYLYEFDGFDHGTMLVPGYDLMLRILRDLGLN